GRRRPQRTLSMLDHSLHFAPCLLPSVPRSARSVRTSPFILTPEPRVTPGPGASHRARQPGGAVHAAVYTGPPARQPPGTAPTRNSPDRSADQRLQRRDRPMEIEDRRDLVPLRLRQVRLRVHHLDRRREPEPVPLVRQPQLLRRRLPDPPLQLHHLAAHLPRPARGLHLRPQPQLLGPELMHRRRLRDPRLLELQLPREPVED